MSDFYEDDEPADAVLTLRRPTIAAVTAQPVTAIDVAQEILSQTGPMDAWKLQKLCFYSQVAHLVTYGQPLFRERIEAWAQGPVVRELYGFHRKKILGQLAADRRCSGGFGSSDGLDRSPVRDCSVRVVDGIPAQRAHTP